MSKKSNLSFNFKTSFVVLATVVVTASAALVDMGSVLYYTSILNYPEHKPFDGTVYPMQKVPNWVKLSETDRAKTYTELTADQLIDLPVYKPDELTVSADNLKWGDPAHDQIRNAKITYSVPYLGNYTFDGRENVGSHPAVDIKVPVGTPIYSIANGTVIKSSDQSAGFGHHIVIMHNNFPSPESPDVQTVIYSSYSHLSTLLVEVGDVVNKGDLIAESGVSGTATTPHLHFQLDRDVAPWHPYWPFTWAEASEAGLDFFTAVNSGLGIENAKATTINPMQYVQAYLNGVTTASAEAIGGYDAASYVEEVEVIAEPEIVAEPIVIEEPEVIEEPVVVEEPYLNFIFDVKSTYYVGADANFTLMLRDQFNNPYNAGFEGGVVVENIEGNAKIMSPILSNMQFDQSATYIGSFKKLQEGRDRLRIKYNDKIYFSDWFDIVDNGGESLFIDVTNDDEYFEAVNYLASESIIEGHADGTFRPLDKVNRVEALKFILEGIDADLMSGEIPFEDISESDWYAEYLYTGLVEKIVNGNPDGTFRPANPVNKAEFFKILFLGMNVDINPKVDVAPYQDVEVDAWFAPYIAYAKELEILDPDLSTISPNAPMTRGEVADAMYRLMKIK